MNESAYWSYTQDAQKADELHAIIKSIAEEEGWLKGIPKDLIAPSQLHTCARVKGLITAEERDLLRRFYK